MTAETDPGFEAPKHKAPPRLAFIEGMRGIAALYVVLGHICSLVDPSKLMLKPSKLPVWMQTVMGPFEYGHLAVAAFIVISGFCLQYAIMERKDDEVKDLKGFFGRRCKRILPPYYACLVVSVIVAIKVTTIPHVMPFTQYLPVTRENVAVHALMIHNLSPDWMYKINGVLWSIAIEFQLYFVFPLLAKGLNRMGALWVLLLTVIVSMMIVDAFPRGIKLYPWFLSLFCLGMAFAYACLKHSKWTPTFPLLFVSGIGLTLYGNVQKWDNVTTESTLAFAVAALLAMGTRAALQHRKFHSGSVFALKPIAVLGAFSYSLYLMHHPILQVVYVFRPASIDGPLKRITYLLGVGLPIVLILSFLFALVFERQWLLRSLKALGLARGVRPPKVTSGSRTIHETTTSQEIP